MAKLPPPPSPLSDSDRETLEQLVKYIPQVRKIVQDCHDCGMEVQAQLERLESSLQLARNLLAKFPRPIGD